LLNSIINNLRSRSPGNTCLCLCLLHSSVPFQERALKNHEIYDESSKILMEIRKKC
ncbi:hypothetical protein BDC45DRAFT_589631, partial [Circinella umbellata]